MERDDQTVYGVLSSLNVRQKRAILTTVDVAFVPVALYLAVFSRDGTPFHFGTLGAAWPQIVILMVFAGLTTTVLGLPRLRLNGFETAGLRGSAAYAVLMAVAAAELGQLAGTALPWSAVVVLGLMFFMGTIGSRLCLRWVLLQVLNSRHPRTAVAIYGAGRTGIQLATALKHDPYVVPLCFVDDNPALHRVLVAGLPVYSPIDMPELVEKKGVTKVLLAMPSISPSKRSRISKQLEPLGVGVAALPSFAQLLGEEPLTDKLAPVSPVEFLQRQSFKSDMTLASRTFRGRTVLVSGAGGSIGSELTRQLLALEPGRIVLLEANEYALYQIDMELRALAADVEIVPVLGSVVDETLCRCVMVEHDVDVVLHAAAYKHVPLVEINPVAGLFNNVFGTKALADAARDAGVDRFILVSTDKAVRPTNVMGASKRLSELIIQDMATRPGPRFAIVRFGNVLGSSGSVIPLFQEQIANGGPVTLTDASVTRYFMTTDEAARLLLISSALARGGDVFVLDMGKPVFIADLARQMIEAAGFTVRDATNPDGDIEVKITGLRPGEKLHEELLLSEDRITTVHPKIMRAWESRLSELELATALRDLRDALDNHNTDAARAVLHKWVEGRLIQPAKQQA